MARYIDVDNLKDNFCKSCSTHKRYHLTVEQCRAKENEQPDSKWCFKMRLIDNTPTADVEEVKHGEWIEITDGVYFCSKCNRTICFGGMGKDFFPYCHCGAKMDGGNHV